MASLSMRRCGTSDPQIWSVGDAVEVPDVLTGQETVLPLAGPANRQGRVAAESIAGRATQFRGVQATAVVSVLGLTVASTGASEKGLKRAGVTSFGKVYLHPGHHAGYYPGARPIHLKLLFSVPDGRILGAQAIGLEGVEKRIDVIATAIQFRGTVHDLAEAELRYAPQFGASKDPVNRWHAGRERVERRHASGRLVRRSIAPPRCCSTCANPTNSTPGTFPTRSTCRFRRCAAVTPSCRRIGRSGLICGVGQRAYLASGSWLSTDINQRICREGIPRIRHSVPSAGRHGVCDS